MSTILNTNGEALKVPRAASGDFSFDIVTAEWNPDITHALRDAAKDTLLEGGVKEENIRLHSVPGTVELVNAAALLRKAFRPAGVIIIGCVIRGDTPHFDYVCQQAAQGTAIMNSDGGTPVTFGVLTTENLRQAEERAGGVLGNKGAEAACAALEMANLHLSVDGVLKR